MGCRLHRCKSWAHPGQQQGRRFPSLRLEQPQSIRRLLVSAFLADSIQHIHSLRASGVISSHAVNASGSDVSAFFKSVGTSCTTPLEIFFGDIDKLSFPKLQRHEDLLLSKECGSFGHGEVLTLRLTRCFDYPLWSYDARSGTWPRMMGNFRHGVVKGPLLRRVHTDDEPRPTGPLNDRGVCQNYKPRLRFFW